MNHEMVETELWLTDAKLDRPEMSRGDWFAVTIAD